MFAEAPDTFLADFGLPVTIGSVSGSGILDMPSEIIAGGMVLTTDYQLTVRSSVFGQPARGTAVTVNGTAYTVRESRLQDDGVFTTIYLSAAA